MIERWDKCLERNIQKFRFDLWSKRKRKKTSQKSDYVIYDTVRRFRGSVKAPPDLTSNGSLICPPEQTETNHCPVYDMNKSRTEKTLQDLRLHGLAILRSICWYMKTISWSFQKTPTWGPFSKTCAFDVRKHRLRVDRRLIRKKKSLFSKISGNVWTEPKGTCIEV